MPRVLTAFLVLIAATAAVAAVAPSVISMPEFPLPQFAHDSYGQPEEVGVVRLMHEFQLSGVRVSDSFETLDSDYLVVSRRSLGLLSAWLEAACKSAGLQLPLARLRTYDGTVYANLLEVATDIAASRRLENAVAIPLGVLICRRTKAWGVLPGDGQRDAYVVVLTEDGYVIYDPPSRQLALLADYPNNTEVLSIRL